jgi:hypothetical protein
MPNYVIVFTSGDPYKGNNWGKQSAAFLTAVRQATGAEPTPLMRTEVLNTLVLSVAVDVGAEALLNAIIKRMRRGLFNLNNSHGTPDCVLAFEVRDIAATDEVARAAFGLSRR